MNKRSFFLLRFINRKRQGVALPILMGVILCLAIWITSLSWTMSNSRHRFTQMIKIRRAYFMARSALQHFFLKVKTMQRRSPESMTALYQATPAEWGNLSKAFVEDLLNPQDTGGSYSGTYGIANFSIESQDTDKGEMSIQILAQGNVEGAGETIRRVYKVTR
ncbi:MAG: hypothetical protein HQM09_01215 [Candidatus Riflebacteria bacterium]|nr:hypothetical protein [Candidatus Riflebacteria bacterium]